MLFRSDHSLISHCAGGRGGKQGEEGVTVPHLAPGCAPASLSHLLSVSAPGQRHPDGPEGIEVPRGTQGGMATGSLRTEPSPRSPWGPPLLRPRPAGLPGLPHSMAPSAGAEPSGQARWQRPLCRYKLSWHLVQKLWLKQASQCSILHPEGRAGRRGAWAGSAAARTAPQIGRAHV